MLKIDNSTCKKSYTLPEIVVELDLEARAGSGPDSRPADLRSNPPSDPDTLPTGE